MLYLNSHVFTLLFGRADGRRIAPLSLDRSASFLYLLLQLLNDAIVSQSVRPLESPKRGIIPLTTNNTTAQVPTLDRAVKLVVQLCQVVQNGHVQV